MNGLEVRRVRSNSIGRDDMAEEEDGGLHEGTLLDSDAEGEGLETGEHGVKMLKVRRER